MERAKFTLAAILLYAVTPCMSVQLLAAENTEPWDAGLAAYARDDFATALNAFRSARDAGQQGPAVHYNIGVCAFQLQQFDEAEASFTYLVRNYPRMRALANYNLGLVAVEQQRVAAAREYFFVAYQQSADDRNIRVLSSMMLRQLDAPNSNQSPRTWRGAVAARAAYDDNIVLRDEAGVPVDTATASPLLDLFGSFAVPLAGIADLSLDTSAYAVSYLDNSDLNQTALRAGVAYAWSSRAWYGRVSLFFGHGSFGGSSYDNSRNFEASASRALFDASVLQFRYRYSHIDAADPVFEGIDGWQQRFEVNYRWQGTLSSFQAALQYEDNQRRDAWLNASRQRLRLSYRKSFSPQWRYEINTEYRASRYTAAQPSRSEDLLSAGIGLARATRSGWEVLAELRYADNASSEAVYAYDRVQFGIGLAKDF